MLEAASVRQPRLLHPRGGVESGQQVEAETAVDRARRLGAAAASIRVAAVDDAAERQQQSRTSASAKRNGRTWLAEPVTIGLVHAADCSIVLVAGLLAHLTAFSKLIGLHSPELFLLIIALLLVPQAFAAAGTYLHLPAVNGPCLMRLLRAWAAVFLCLLALTFITKAGDHAFYLWMSLWFSYGLIGLYAVHLLFAHQVRRWRREGCLTSNLVIVGSGDLARRLADRLQGTADSPVRLIGMFCDPTDAPSKNVTPCTVMSGPDDLACFARANQIDQVAIALPWHADDRLRFWMKYLKDLPADILLCSAVPDRSFAQCHVAYLNGMPLLKLSERPLPSWSYIVKVVEDRLLAVLLVILVGPLMLLLALLVRLDSAGPALFRQKRHGLNNAVIDVLKFRTMHVDATEFGASSVTQARRDDPRVTRVGRWLRRTSLDELPQLLNVLRGEMSLVGPRPHALAHNDYYAKLIDGYLARHRVKPGITGWAQINGFRGETDTLEKMEGRVQCDLYYIDHWSLLFDLRILARTLLVGFVHRNAY